MIAIVPDNSEERRQCGFSGGTPPLIEHGLGVEVCSGYDISFQARRVAAGLKRDRRVEAAREFLGQAMEPEADRRIAEAVLGFVPQ